MRTGEPCARFQRFGRPSRAPPCDRSHTSVRKPSSPTASSAAVKTSLRGCFLFSEKSIGRFGRGGLAWVALDIRGAAASGSSFLVGQLHAASTADRYLHISEA